MTPRRPSHAAFWGGAALIGWTYAAFPLVILARARVRPRAFASGPVTPTVSIVIAAHNEQAAIGAKVANLLALDYPADRVEILIASDGSTDATVARAAEAAAGDGDRVRVLDLPRTGKAGVLNAAVAQATGDILVFSDANSMFAADALRELVAPFADEEVGGVAGDQRYLPDDGDLDGAASGERGYWDIDRRIKQAESDAGNVISATGAIYAIRRSLFREVPEGVTDDFTTSTGVIDQGRRLVFAPGAMAFEPVGSSASVEYGRKVRVMTRGLNAVLVRRALLDPRRHGFYALQLFSHKVLRRLMAVPLLVVFAATLRLARRSPLYGLAALAQGGVYGLGAAGLALGRHPAGRHRLLALPAYFCLVNLASLQALGNVLRGRTVNRWEPQREEET
ncbi:glycosyltransferase family 2 protein [Baekduia soli]|uniref:Glycosyltransferase family 2 protein n=1 Tax=Baekduia soli TaxID=496014 RepID=A0A5B8U7N4_9ACTN|nr:glycosyltransferase family 2 protein [Baekduia soli]QEC49139.1 glycosyltransferase family 2 protein [Baekduia soli]